jgi:integrase
MQSNPRRRHEAPIARINPSGRRVWVARYTNRHGQRKSAGSYDLKRDAQHAIDAAYERESAQPTRLDTLGGYAALWRSVHPRSERTNTENVWRIGVVLAIDVEGLELRHWAMSDIRRRHALAVQAKLLEQGRSAEGATGILRAMSAMVNDAVDDEVCDTNPWLRLGVRLNDPRVTKAPRPKRMWTMKQMHAFAAAAGAHEPMIRMLSDCGLRLGELPSLGRADLRPGWVHVARTAHEGRVQSGTKTTHHKREEEQGRDVPVPPTLEAMLRAMPPRIDAGGLLFPTPTGMVWRERNFRRDVWTPAQEATGMDCRPQEFRASWESIMRAEGVDPADLAKYAGHSIQTANSRYVQALNRSADQVRDVIG